MIEKKIVVRFPVSPISSSVCTNIYSMKCGFASFVYRAYTVSCIKHLTLSWVRYYDYLFWGGSNGPNLNRHCLFKTYFLKKSKCAQPHIQSNQIKITHIGPNTPTWIKADPRSTSLGSIN